MPQSSSHPVTRFEPTAQLESSFISDPTIEMSALAEERSIAPSPAPPAAQGRRMLPKRQVRQIAKVEIRKPSVVDARKLSADIKRPSVRQLGSLGASSEDGGLFEQLRQHRASLKALVSPRLPEANATTPRSRSPQPRTSIERSSSRTSCHGLIFQLTNSLACFTIMAEPLIWEFGFCFLGITEQSRESVESVDQLASSSPGPTAQQPSSTRPARATTPGERVNLNAH